MSTSQLPSRVSKILELFDDREEFNRLARRRDNFRVMIEHVLLQEDDCRLIVETGTAWCKDNWEWQGQSTLVWDWLIEQDHFVQARSIDVNPEAEKICEAQTKHIEYVTKDSVQALHYYSYCRDGIDPSRIALLYLDSFDWTEQANMDAAFHAMAELAAIYAVLPLGCMIVCDDRHGDMKGKHWLVEQFFVKLGIEPVFKNHQIGWIKE